MAQLLDDDGGPAFPQPFSSAHPEFDQHGHVRPSGLSVRDYFAAQALAGLLVQRGLTQEPTVAAVAAVAAQAATLAYRYADALLVARAPSPPEAQP